MSTGNGAGRGRCVVVVDPFGTAQEYPAAFAEAGVDTIGVVAAEETLADPFYRASWHPENFREVHTFDGDLPKLAEVLRAHDPICVIPGAETGVELADALTDLVVPGTGNLTGRTASRRDKCAMGEAVAAAGLPHLRQVCSDDPAVIDAWIREHRLRSTPLVVKPPKSGGTDHVHLAPPGSDWRKYFDQIYGQVNELGIRNDGVLVQEFADGTEYLVDSYSVDGRHGLVDVCRYTKVQVGDRIGIYDLIDFVPPDHPDVAAIWPYIQQVLDALGVRNGCAHNEVILTADGPRLLEVGARPAGGGHQMITKLATGSNHILQTVAHRVRGEFTEGYQLIQRVCSVVIFAPHAGIWRNVDVLDPVDGLDTFWAKHIAYATGDLVPAPAGLFTFLGWVVLASTDSDAVTADYRRIKALERQIQVDPADEVTPAASA